MKRSVFEPVSRVACGVFETVDSSPAIQPVEPVSRGACGVFEAVDNNPQSTSTIQHQGPDPHATLGEEHPIKEVLSMVGTAASVINTTVGLIKLFSGDATGLHQLLNKEDVN